MTVSRSFAVLVLLLPCDALSQTPVRTMPSNAKTAEQNEFSAEDLRVKRPIRVPESIVKIVSQDADVQELLKDEPTHVLPERWLSASEAHLAGPTEKDLIVVGTGLIRGANVTTFWVFAPTEGGFRLLLETIGHDLVVKSTRSNGYKDIAVLAATAVESTEMNYRYEGKAYAKVLGKIENIR